MKFDKNQNIEELLNGFIDGELSVEDATQVQQLIEQDQSIARRLHEIETCRLLVSSLPPAEPPAEVVSGIKELVQGKWSQGVRVDYSHNSGSGSLKLSRGHWHLFTRQVLAASIVVGLVGLLGAVIYRIVGPEKTTTLTVADSTRLPQAAEPKPEIRMQNTEHGTIRGVPVGDRIQNAERPGVYLLQLTTADFAGIDAYINKLLEESTWLKFQRAAEPRLTGGQSVYTVYCSKTGLDELMTNLAPVWSRFDSATLVMHNADTSDQVAVEQVRPEQVSDIAKRDTIAERMKLAKDFAVINDIRRLMPQERMLALGNAGGPEPELIAIPKPVLTSGDKSSITAPKGATDQIQVDLSIVVSA
ncbi:MAG: hypothetical protein ABSH16_00530, partial [Sedimentisphaerales bacterium]